MIKWHIFTKVSSATGNFAPDFHQGLCPWTPLGARSIYPHYCPFRFKWPSAIYMLKTQEWKMR